METNASFPNSLKKTLEAIITDNDGVNASMQFPKYMKRAPIEDAYVDDAEYAGPGTASEYFEGQELEAGQLYEGPLTRYRARNFGLRLIISNNALDDNKYPEVIKAAKRLKVAMARTMDIDAANVLNRAATTGYVGGDGQTLASASHTLAAGGTFSNTLATPMSPSQAALMVVRQNVMKLPGVDGVIEGYEIEKILHPIDQTCIWEIILGTQKSTGNNFNDINVVSSSKMGYENIPVKHWSASTTNWAVTTSCDDGLKWYDRKKPSSQMWPDNDIQGTVYAITARWTRGWTNARGFYFSAA